MVKLPKFEGKQVAKARITIPSISGGFNDGLDIEPMVLAHGQVGYGIFEFEVRDVDHPRLNPGDASILVREHVLKVPSVMIVTEAEDADAVRTILAVHVESVRRAKESMEGQGSLEDEIGDDQLTAAELKIRKNLRGEKA